MSLQRYSLGDVVTIRHDLHTYNGPSVAEYPYLIDEMRALAGKQATITERSTPHTDNCYYVSFGGGVQNKWTWSADFFEPTESVKQKTITIVASTEDEARSKIGSAITEAFNPPRKWTAEDANLAREWVLKHLARVYENTDHTKNIIFSSPSIGCTTAAMILLGGCWPKSLNKNFQRVQENIPFDVIHTASVYLRKGETNSPWVGKMFALSKLLSIPVPEWAR